MPFLTTLAPSQRYCQEHRKLHKTLTDWARQLVLQVRHWLPQRELVLVADSAFAALDLLMTLTRQAVIRISRLRLDAALYEPAPPRRPGTKGCPRTKGRRLPNLAELLAATTTHRQRVSVPGWYGQGERMGESCSATAIWRHAGLPVVPLRWVLLRDPQDRFDARVLLCTDPAREPLQIVRRFIQRWQVEVTYREVHDHLGVETPRQWSDCAIAPTTPCLLGLFSLVTLLVTRLGRHARVAVPAESLYRKPVPLSATPWPPCAERFDAKAVSSCPSARMKRCNCRPLSSSA